MRDHAPSGACAYNPTQGILHYSDLRVPLFGIGGQQRQLQSNEGPLIVTYITWIGFSGDHTSILPSIVA